jgi:hypothetical protein
MDTDEWTDVVGAVPGTMRAAEPPETTPTALP